MWRRKINKRKMKEKNWSEQLVCTMCRRMQWPNNTITSLSLFGSKKCRLNICCHSTFFWGQHFFWDTNFRESNISGVKLFVGAETEQSVFSMGKRGPPLAYTIFIIIELDEDLNHSQVYPMSFTK